MRATPPETLALDNAFALIEGSRIGVKAGKLKQTKGWAAYRPPSEKNNSRLRGDTISGHDSKDGTREQVIQIVENYIDAVRRNDVSALPTSIRMHIQIAERTPIAVPLRFGKASTSLPES